MTALRVLVVDDEPLARQRLCQLLQELGTEAVSTGAGWRLIGEAANCVEAQAFVDAHQVDVVLLDIHMPGETGLAWARRLADSQHSPAVVFCTAHDEYAVQAFDVAAVAYLLKPVQRQKLREALCRAQQLNAAQLSALRQLSLPPLLSRHGGSLKTLAFEQLRYFRAEQKYVVAVYPGGELLLDESLKQLSERYGDALLLVHRNALVATAHLRGIEKQGLQHRALLDGVAEGPLVSRRHLPSVRRWLQSS